MSNNLIKKTPYGKNCFSSGVFEDNLKFRSDREAYFYRKFLKESKLTFQQEKDYPFRHHSWRSDFYINELDLYIEVCMVSPVADYRYRYETIDGHRIFLDADYKERHLVKAGQGKWSPSRGKWYFDFRGDSDLRKRNLEFFKRWIPQQLYSELMKKQKLLTSEQKKNKKSFDRLQDKLRLCRENNLKMILVEEKNIDKCDTLLDIISWSEKSY